MTDKDTLEASEIPKFVTVLENSARLLNTMPEYASLPEESRSLISSALNDLCNKLREHKNNTLSRDTLQLHHSMAFGDAADEWLSTSNDPMAVLSRTPQSPEGRAMIDYIMNALEPHIYTNITTKIFNRLVQARHNTDLHK